jgi:hypothetical protein
MLISVILGGTTLYTENNIPYADGGYASEMEESLLSKKVGGHDNEDETVDFVEYWFEGELVHRSVNMTLKKMPSFDVEVNSVG